jgi:hypothetical protein
MKAGPLLVAALLVLTPACSGDETGAPPSAPATASSALTPATTAATTSTSPASTTLPSRPDTTIAPEPGDPSFLVAGSDGMTRVDLEGAEVSILGGVAAELAYSDGAGGIVYQEPAPWPNPHAILHQPVGGLAPSPVVEPVSADAESGEAVSVELRGVAWPDGEATVLYTSLTYRCGPPWQTSDGLLALPICDEPIHARGLEDGDDQIVGHLGGWECAAQGPVTVAGERVVGVTAYYFDDDVQSFNLGEPGVCHLLELSDPQPPAGEGWSLSDEPGRWRLVALAPNGATLAYVESSSWHPLDGGATTTRVGNTWTIEPTEVTAAFVVVDLGSGEELRRVDITDFFDPEGTLVWFDYDGTHAVISSGVFDWASQMTVPQHALVVLPDGSVTELGIAGTATIWR